MSNYGSQFVLGTTAGTAAEGTAPAAAVSAHNSDASAHPGTFAPAAHTSGTTTAGRPIHLDDNLLSKINLNLIGG